MLNGYLPLKDLDERREDRGTSMLSVLLIIALGAPPKSAAELDLFPNYHTVGVNVKRQTPDPQAARRPESNIMNCVRVNANVRRN